jgi:hypothetical protein
MTIEERLVPQRLHDALLEAKMELGILLTISRMTCGVPTGYSQAAAGITGSDRR